MSNKLDMGIIDVNTAIRGVNVNFPIQMFISISTDPGQITLTADAVVKMDDFQAKFLQILTNQPIGLTNDAYGPQVQLTSIDNASAKASGDQMVVDIAMSFHVSEIAKGLPYPVVHTHEVCVLGVCADIPDGIEWRNGADIHTDLFDEGATATLVLSLGTPDGASIEVYVNSAQASPRGDLGKFINKLLAWVNSDLTSLLTAELKTIADAGQLRQTLPKNMEKYNPVVRTVQFHTSDTGSLNIICSFQASLTEDQLAEIVKEEIAGGN